MTEVKTNTPLDWSNGELAEGLRCYRNEDFFLAHEHWESVWLESQDQEKIFLQALIQTAVAFHHLQRGNSVGATSLLRAALRRIEWFPEDFGGIAVTPLQESIRAWLEALDRQKQQLRHSFPQIILHAAAC